MKFASCLTICQNWRATDSLLHREIVRRRHHRQDADGRVAFWNTSAERLYGYEAEEMLGPDI